MENKKKDDGDDDDDIDYLHRTTTTSTYTCKNYVEILWFSFLGASNGMCGVYYKKCSDLIYTSSAYTQVLYCIRIKYKIFTCAHNIHLFSWKDCCGGVKRRQMVFLFCTAQLFIRSVVGGGGAFFSVVLKGIYNKSPVTHYIMLHERTWW